jgi:nicotinamidase/pyrazinamidase
MGSKHFAENGGEWPVHCLMNISGAALHKNLRQIQGATIINKGTGFYEDAYSAFEGNEKLSGDPLRVHLLRRKIFHLYICGLATDYCVIATVKDALKEGFTVTVISDACRAVNPDNAEACFAEMRAFGAEVI